MNVTVLMPAYNASAHITEAIDSILTQTFQEFKLLIINDGSTDNTDVIIREYDDNRIKYVIKEQNTGLIDTLNYGFELADTKYLVRMDADDISHPERLEKLVAFMEVQPNIDICGTTYLHFNNESGIKQEKPKYRPETHNDIESALLSYCSFTHGTAIFRLKSWRKAQMRYNSNYPHAEDYKMLTDAVHKNLVLHNLQEPLYFYRIHEDQVSNRFNKVQFENTNRIKLEQLHSLKIHPTPEEEKIYLKFIWGKGIANIEDFIFIKTLTKHMIKNNKEINIYDHKAFKKYLSHLMELNTKLFFIRKKYSPKVLKELFNIKYNPWHYLNFKDFVAILIKSIIFHKA